MSAGRDQIRRETRPRCLLCGSGGSPAYQGLRDRLFDAPGEWTLHACGNRSCRLYWLSPMPIEDDLHIAYASYFTHEPLADAVSPRRRSRLAAAYALAMRLTSTAAERERAFDMYLAGSTPGRLLEVGCGDGARLLHLRKMGWEVEGQDIDPKARAHGLGCEGITVHQAPLERLGLPEGRYDAIIMNHVIEHVADPLAVLRECRRLLAEGGHVTLVTPNSRSLGHRLFGQEWMWLDPQRHLFLFSVLNLPALARLAGFERIAAWTSSANAEGVGIASWDILRRGRHCPGGPPAAAARIAGIGFQLVATMAHRFAPQCGEEAVLRAWK